MKTKNNVQKSALSLIVALFLTTTCLFQVSGIEKYSKNNHNASIALEVAVDKKLAVESWMTNDALFASAASSVSPAAEPPLMVEEWMTDDSNFSHEITPDEKPANQKKIEIWKVQNEKYGNRKFILTQVNDRKLEIESWMVDSSFWQ